jgi:hypothetical protein
MKTTPSENPDCEFCVHFSNLFCEIGGGPEPEMLRLNVCPKAPLDPLPRLMTMSFAVGDLMKGTLLCSLLFLSSTTAFLVAPSAVKASAFRSNPCLVRPGQFPAQCARNAHGASLRMQMDVGASGKKNKPKIAVVGAGWAGWAAAKALCENGCEVRESCPLSSNRLHLLG